MNKPVRPPEPALSAINILIVAVICFVLGLLLAMGWVAWEP